MQYAQNRLLGQLNWEARKNNQSWKNTQYNQQMSDQDHYFQPKMIHEKYFLHQPLLQPETFTPAIQRENWYNKAWNWLHE